VPKILVLKDNRVAACGDFDQITKAGFNVLEILQSRKEFVEPSEQRRKEDN
jgi:hypothetical protein